MRTTVVVPWRPGCQHREASWQWVRARYELALPGAKIVEATISDDRQWSTSRAIMENLSGDLIVMTGADCWSPGLPRAISAVVDSGAMWAMPHTLVYRLTPDASASVRDGEDPEGLPTVEAPYRGIKGDGICVVRRETLERVPQDVRFVGWGKHGRAWRDAMDTFFGPPWRGRHPLYHLWHPPQQRIGRATAFPANEELYARYAVARGRPAEMRALLDEALLALGGG